MPRMLLFPFLLFFLVSCSSRAQDAEYLLRYEDGDASGYKTPGGEIVIPAGKYDRCFTDTFRTYAVVVKAGENRLTAIDRREKELYEVFRYHNGPDEPREGMFRIVQDGRMGFADAKTGAVRIAPKATFAYPFDYGMTRVCDSCRKVPNPEAIRGLENRYEGDWYYIDRNGSRIATNKGKAYPETVIDDHVAQLVSLRKANKLRKMDYPQMSACSGALEGYYQGKKLQYIEAHHGGGLGDGYLEKQIWFKDSSVVKIVLTQATADMEQFHKRYPGKELNEQTAKLLTYTRSTTTIRMTEPVTIVQSPPATGEDVFTEEDLENTLDCVETLMIELWTAPAIEAEIRAQ